MLPGYNASSDGHQRLWAVLGRRMRKMRIVGNGVSAVGVSNVAFRCVGKQANKYHKEGGFL